MKIQKARKMGAPPKIPGGLQKVLFIRAGEDLVNALDAFLERERRQHPGRCISRADIARDLLYQAVKNVNEATTM